MREEYSIDEIRDGLRAWTKLITPNVIDGVRQVNKDLIIKYLKQGFCIQITPEDFKKWNAVTNQPKFYGIHAYPALFDDVLKFVLIDSVSDLEEQKDLENILVKDFHHGETLQIDISNFIVNSNRKINLNIALRRQFMWNMYCRQWLDSIVESKNSDSNNIFKAIRIPFKDFKSVFLKGNKVEVKYDAIAFLGLKPKEEGELYDIEFLITNELLNYYLPKSLYDISRPVPPFGVGITSTGFKLMPVVDNL